MAHWEQQEFVRRIRKAFPEYFNGSRTIEVGSGEIGGEGVRELFHNGEYIGVDLAEGPGVDRICAGQDIQEPTGSFDVAVSCECFEHNPYWLETFVNMLRLLRPDGLLIMSCALTGRQEHGTHRRDPNASLAKASVYKGYYRNLSARDFVNRLDLNLHFQAWFFHENIFHKDLYFAGLKRGPTSSGKINRICTLHASVKQIRREQPLSPTAVVAAYAKHYVKRSIVTLVEEQAQRYRERQRSKKY